MAIPLPESPRSPEPHLPAPNPFGSVPADLDLDFEQADRATLTTKVIAYCCADSSLPHIAREELAWNLPLSARIIRLLRIVELTIGSDVLPLALPCPHADCRQKFEIALPFASIAPEAGEPGVSAKVVQFPLENHAPIILRLPTGRDQLAWGNQHFENQQDALMAIVRSLAIEPGGLPVLAPDQLAPLAAAMEAADPLVAFTVHTSCPQCHRNAIMEVDLEAAALHHLASFRRALLRDVHELATRYGWSEDQVLAIPARRRSEYIRLITTGRK
jgi:hypothetical protein